MCQRELNTDFDDRFIAESDYENLWDQLRLLLDDASSVEVIPADGGYIFRQWFKEA